MTKGTADPYDIEPSRITLTETENGLGDSYTFNTAIFEDPSKLPNNSYYVANGQLDGDGKVKDKILLVKNFVGLKGKFNNVQLTLGSVNGGDLEFDMPCKEVEIEDGIIISKSIPLAPLDKIQTFEASSVTTGTMRVGPNYTKERVTSGPATYMN
jgi:hypothetical protein